MEKAESYESSRLYRLRHSAAHLMAQAVTELFPGARLAIGPPIETGFYYDIEFLEPVSESDLKTIESRMRELAKLDMPIERRVAADREEARRIILEECTHGQPVETAHYKLLLLDMVPEGEEISFYDQRAVDRNGEERRFIDLCRGPHIESTKPIQHFKLMHMAGAYWRGDAKGPQLTRIYGTAFETKAELAEHLHFLEEAKKRDHRRLGRELGLFIFSETVGQGLPLWLPKGAVLRETMSQFMRDQQVRRGYEPVVTPNIALKKLFEISGHLPTYQDKVFPLMEDEEGSAFALKPMNCPFHIEIYKSSMRSYRELPIRYAEFGTVYRYEQSGELSGMLRVRGFTQDDAHLFVRPDQLLSEFKGVVELMMAVLDRLGLPEFKARVGIREPGSDKYVGSDENWALAEEAIIQACREMGLSYFVSEGDAAFYGPKLDLLIKDALRREWQMGTVQVDYNLPERFGLEYIGEDSQPHRPIMIHRAPFGSLERMIGLLTEQYAGAFPFWLAPVQVVILPISDRHNAYARALAASLQGFAVMGDLEGEQQPFPEVSSSGLSLRVEVDESRNTLGKKIRSASQIKAPAMIVIGDQDCENGTAALRLRSGEDLGSLPLAEAFTRLAAMAEE
jgi:threonyl-tRNA synthetase